MKDKLGHIWYGLVHIILKCFFGIFCSFKVKGVENIPKSGPVIFAANHTSYTDPPLFGAISKRRVNCMAKKELFEVSWLNPIIKSLGAFPVDRKTGDTSAIKTAVAILKRGEILGIFPEGRRIKDNEKSSAEAGISLIAKMSGADILPIAFIGSKEGITFKGFIPRFKPIKAIIGKPIKYVKAATPSEEKENMKTFPQRIMKEIEDMIDAENKNA